ncbi:MAG: hypothetical protein ACD_4C00135G0005 [uncultured bacterium (gcode 4)]|uniref:Uncharacterized protein n=1 Tax=uncultured bacterium (gcode 4) TaxID=1234023 RepID=K2F6X0_9BACT|nr:MAG: hypothetical protein ACD_4C00135G0005 [uncultured bacterium (gcode 4)]
MLKINSNLTEKIKQKISEENSFYISIKLETSKIFFIFFSSLYFFTYLCILWWFMLEYTSKALFVIYPLFVFSSFALIYDSIVYSMVLYTENKVFKYFVLIILILLYIFLILLHLGFKLNF